MKWWMPAVVVYIVICLIGVMAPASQGYDVFSWKLFVTQLYAIPIALIIFSIAFMKHRKAAH